LGCDLLIKGAYTQSRLRQMIFGGAMQHVLENALIPVLFANWGGPMTTQSLPSLYDRLGGVYSIATVVDDFIERIMIDPRLNANPKVDEAHHRVPPAGFKYLVTEMVCWATGGPQKYTGRSMKESHQQLMITAAEWEAFLDDLQQTLEKFAVPQAEQAEIKAVVASTRADIVV
jgi:hemoglobin